MNSNWSYSLETPNLSQNQRFFDPCDLQIWWMTLKNNRAPLLSNIKVCASFHNHMWIKTGVTVQKRLSCVLTSVTFTFDLWPWPFAWTSLLSLVITPANFMMIQWWEHSQKGVTDRQTDGQTDRRTDRQTAVFYLNFLWHPSECPFRTSNTHNSYMISEFFTRPKHDFTRLGRVDGWLGRTLRQTDWLFIELLGRS